MTSKLNFKTISTENLATVVSRCLSQDGIDSTLVGGSCVTLYSENQFMSYDLDFISYEPLGKIKKSLEKLGFLYDKKKYFTRTDCPFFIEFLNPPIAIGNEPVTTVNCL